MSTKKAVFRSSNNTIKTKCKFANIISNNKKSLFIIPPPPAIPPLYVWNINTTFTFENNNPRETFPIKFNKEYVISNLVSLDQDLNIRSGDKQINNKRVYELDQFYTQLYQIFW